MQTGPGTAPSPAPRPCPPPSSEASPRSLVPFHPRDLHGARVQVRDGDPRGSRLPPSYLGPLLRARTPRQERPKCIFAREQPGCGCNRPRWGRGEGGGTDAPRPGRMRAAAGRAPRGRRARMGAGWEGAWTGRGRDVLCGAGAVTRRDDHGGSRAGAGGCGGRRARGWRSPWEARFPATSLSPAARPLGAVPPAPGGRCEAPRRRRRRRGPHWKGTRSFRGDGREGGLHWPAGDRDRGLGRSGGQSRERRGAGCGLRRD